MRFVLVWIGMYATNIIFTTDMAQACESFFIEHSPGDGFSGTGPF
jgi:MFS transporter, DHA2 family, multidrug resistance protein